MHPLMKQLSVGVLTLGGAVTLLATEARAIHPAIPRIPPARGWARPTVRPPGGIVHSPTPSRPIHTWTGTRRTPHPPPPAPRPKPAVKPSDPTHEHAAGREHHSDRDGGHSRGENSRRRGSSWFAWWVSAPGASGGGSPSASSSSTSPGGGSAPYYEPNLVGQLAALQLLGESLEHRRSEKQPDDGKNAALLPERNLDPYREAFGSSLGRPSPPDISSGKTLNDLLREAQILRELNFPGMKVPLGKDIVTTVNVVPSKDPRSPALLKGKLSYPEALRASEFQTHRELLDALLPKAIQQAGRGRVDMDQLKEMQTAVEKIEEELARQKMQEQQASEIRKLPTTEYIRAKRFVSQLSVALRVLGQPEAKNYFNGRYSARGETITDLVDHMTREGLKFAPAVAGDEIGYEALHRAFVAYFVAVYDAQRSEE